MICVAATTLLSLAAPAPTNRRELSFEVIAGFLPSTDVCDENQLDLDQYNFKMAMFSGSAYDDAEAIYKQGGFSEPVATLTLADPIGQDFPAGTAMTAKNAADSTISGTVFEKYTAGSNTLKFRYRVTCDNPNKCQVGGLSTLYLSAP